METLTRYWTTRLDIGTNSGLEARIRKAGSRDSWTTTSRRVSMRSVPAAATTATAARPSTARSVMFAMGEELGSRLGDGCLGDDNGD